jgi:hypothetical protein
MDRKWRMHEEMINANFYLENLKGRSIHIYKSDSGTTVP